MEIKYTFQDLLNIMEKLRGKDGCPWDKQQTIQSLKKYILEEAYEVVDAIDKNWYNQVCDELGDVLLQIVFQSQIAKEEEKFTIDDVINSICVKMINRHPHVFGEENFETPQQVNEKWHEIKKQEKEFVSYADDMKNLPQGMSALLRSSKIQQKASRAGFEWENISDAFDKIYEEIDEVKEHINKDTKDKLTSEIGDLIFAVVKVAVMLGVDPETALLSTNNKFINRFEYIENNSIETGKKIDNMTLEEMDKLWKESKKIYK